MIGFTSVTFRKYSVDKIIKLAKQNDVGGIEWGGDVHVVDLETAASVREKCKAAGIAVLSYGSYFVVGKNTLGEFITVCEIANELGAPVVRVWLGEKSSKKTNESEVQQLLEQTRAIAAVAAEKGLVIAFEFHNNTYNDNGVTSKKFLSMCNLPNVKTYWQPLFKGNDTEHLIAVIDDIVNVHVFYWNAAGKRFLLAKGSHKWRAWTKILTDNNCECNLILEFVKRDSKRSFKKDIAKLNEMYFANIVEK